MCFEKLAKILLTLVNVVFVATGLILTLLGAAARFNLEFLKVLLFYVPGIRPILLMLQTFDLSTDSGSTALSAYYNVSLTLMIIGACLFAMGFLGCCGAYCKSKLALLLFSIFLIALALGELGVIVWIAVDEGSFQSTTTTLLKNLMTDQYTGTGMYYDIDGVLTLSPNTADQSIDYLQVGIGCCGAGNASDWLEAYEWTNEYLLPGNITLENAMVPLSCCTADNPSSYPLKVDEMTFVDDIQCLTYGDPSSTSVYSQGCVDAIISAAETYSTVTYAVVGGILGLEVLEVICALYLRRQMSVSPL